VGQVVAAWVDVVKLDVAEPEVAPGDNLAEEEEVARGRPRAKSGRGREQHRQATTAWPWQAAEQREADESTRGATWLLSGLVVA